MAESAVSPFALPEPFEAWFAARGWQARPHQLALAEQSLNGESALLIAPTGGGKTLAGFLGSLVELSGYPPPLAGEVAAQRSEGAGGGKSPLRPSGISPRWRGERNGLPCTHSTSLR